MSATSLRITTIVVLSIAVLAGLAVITLAWCMISEIKPEQALLTAFVGIASGLVGALTGLLINTRTSLTPGTPNDLPTINAKIVNTAKDPAQVEMSEE